MFDTALSCRVPVELMVASSEVCLNEALQLLTLVGHDMGWDGVYKGELLDSLVGLRIAWVGPRGGTGGCYCDVDIGGDVEDHAWTKRRAARLVGSKCKLLSGKGDNGASRFENVNAV